MIKILKRTVKDSKFRKKRSYVTGSWVHAESLTEKEEASLVKDFGLDEKLIEDALDPYEVPRLEVEGEDVYIFTRFPVMEKDRASTTPLLIVYRKDSIITVSQKPLPFFEELKDPKKMVYSTQKTKFLLQIFSEINTLYNSSLMNITKTVRSKSVAIEDIGNKDIIGLLGFESALNDFMGALIPMNTTLESILSGKFLTLYEKDEDLVEDLSLSTEQLVELGKSTMKNIVNIREVYSTLMSNSLNKVMKFLTAITVILTIPTIISSAYGMNLELPFSEHPLVFVWLILVSILLSAILVWLFIKKKWM